MNCPKCKQIIDDKTLVCPNCKKVLKLVCPVCSAVNKSNTCVQCGFAIVSKCHKCGKINQTINGKCSKCGFDTYTSVAINSSNIEEFACLTIEFPNIKEIKKALGSKDLFEKFSKRLDLLINGYLREIGLTRQIFENVYVIRFNKDYTFSASVKKAINAAIEILNSVVALNFKLKKLQKPSLECKMAVLKRDIYSKQIEYKSGIDIKMLYLGKPELKHLSNLQVIVDSAVYQSASDDFKFSSLGANLIKNEMIILFELILKDYIKTPHEEVEELEEENVLPVIKPEYEQKIEIIEDDIYNIESINFDELKCSFSKVHTIDLISALADKYAQNNKQIIAIKAKPELFPKSDELLGNLEQSGIFDTVFKVTCYDEMKYKPYGFFYELISGIYNYSQSPKNIENFDFSVFKDLDPSGFVKDLITFKKREFPHPEDVRYSLFEIFFSIFFAMENVLLYVENIEKIDDTSYEILQILFARYDKVKAGFLFVGDSEFSLHRQAHFLLSQPYYSEISVLPTSFERITDKNKNVLKEIVKSQYASKIELANAGGTLYFTHIINYMMDRGYLYNESGVLKFAKEQSIVLPSTLNDLIQKRLSIIAKNKDLYKLFGSILLLGPRVDFVLLNSLQIKDDTELLKTLMNKDFISLYNNSIYVVNYNLMKENFIASCSPEVLSEIASNILEKAFGAELIAPMDAILNHILQDGQKEFLAWESLALLNTSVGDFSAYLNCSLKLLKLIDNRVDDTSQISIEEYKLSVYENIANMLYKYTPEKIQHIAQIILENLEKSTDDKKVINLCNKMLQGCLISGNYSDALRLIYKILSKYKNTSMNPLDEKFSLTTFLISLVKVEVLFSVGNFKDCIESGEEILNAISVKKVSELKPDNFSKKQFDDLLLDCFSFVALSKVVMLQDDLQNYIQRVESLLGEVPDYYRLFLIIADLIKGKSVETSNLGAYSDRFSKVLCGFISAFSKKDDYRMFAKEIYQSKITAKGFHLTQFELISDLLIGYSYFKLEEYKKASKIYYNILETTTQNGLKAITYFVWYLIVLLKIEQRDIDVAYGVANNAIIKLEQDLNATELMLFLFKKALSKIFYLKNESENANLCLNQTKYIKEKYGLELQVEN